MKQPFNVVALFCEDIREEKRDLRTLVGLIPDNVNVASPPMATSPGAQVTHGPVEAPLISKLCVYVRLNFDPNFDLGDVHAYLVQPDGSDVDMGPLDASVVAQAKATAIERGNPLAGVIFTITMGNLGLPKSGLMKMEVEVNGERYLAGALTFRDAANDASTASPLHS